ncbi:HutD/Ves family protein [Dongia sedimenti]|uniref:HutD family protein n=1 Tax=Dongia sedimenti TaxID=3064282 RepID=A0ABU0YLC9_9PROT|nr:HutD family protein [Rhodospirillaceae bacterium R-7]
MQLTHLTAADYRRMPWKNGGGTTTELMIEPSDAALGYDWRLSIAEVAQSGPFSDFTGYDRTTMLVEGAGFTLAFPQQPAQHFSRTFEPFRFSGESPCDCTLIDGPVRDFNLIARRGLTAILDVLRLVPGEESVAAAPITVLHLFRGQIAACGRDLAAGDTLRIDGAVGRPRITATRPSILAVIRIGG